MYRAPELRKLSREHNDALTLARDVRWARLSGEAWLAQRAAFELALAWQTAMEAHFGDEERVLRPYFLDDERRDFDEQHARLRKGFADLLATVGEHYADPDLAADLADALRAHVRWEEQSLYPALQNRLQPQELATVGAALGVR